MLELPECYTIANQLTETVQGKRIQNVYANTSPHGFAFFFGDPAAYHERLSGKTIDSVHALAGMVELHLGDKRLLLGDGVNIRYFPQGEALPKKHQLHIELEDFSSLVCTVQMYGGMWAFAAGENDDNFYYTVAKEKPSPLTDAFHFAYFEAIAKDAKPTLSAKALLATEQRIPGLGNGVLQDILFNAGIHPKRKVQNLSPKELETLFDSIKETLQQMAMAGGRDTEKDLFGSKGGYQTILSSKTYKAPCKACGDAIVRQAYLGGNVYFCPTCQPLAN